MQRLGGLPASAGLPCRAGRACDVLRRALRVPAEHVPAVATTTAAAARPGPAAAATRHLPAGGRELQRGWCVQLTLLHVQVVIVRLVARLWFLVLTELCGPVLGQEPVVGSILQHSHRTGSPTAAAA